MGSSWNIEHLILESKRALLNSIVTKIRCREPIPSVSKMKRSISLTQGPSKNGNVSTNLMDLSQDSTVDLSDDLSQHNDILCKKCNKGVSTDAVHVTALKWCICEHHYHGTCLDIANPTMLSFLHVVVDIGGWACEECRKRGGKAPRVNKNSGNINNDLAQIKTQLFSISEVLKNVTAFPASKDSGDVERLSYSQVLRSSLNPASSSLDTNVRTAVLSAVHTEFKSITNRSLNVVVTGLKPSTIATDAVQFSELCASELFIYPNVKSTHRLGNVIHGKIQPLLVTLQTTDDVHEVLSTARLLRNSANDRVRDSIYINKHMTKAESLAAFNDRKQRREKRGNRNTDQSNDHHRPEVLVSCGDRNTATSNRPSLSSGVSSPMVNVPPLRAASTTQFAHPPTSILIPSNIPVGHNQVFVPVPSYASVAAPASTSVDSFCNFDHGNVVHAIPPNISYPSSNYAMLPINSLSSSQPHSSVYRVIQSHDILPPNSSTGSSQ